ncbi:hypothetical protein BDD43_1312 [Mucilaginibacter gracilis]|uniref:Uncharacterized protein n=1 Tax=Mucilaginibacter gracilis TaxID=423350 RepID=A0A495IYM5_9SPHI|nr:hypothetical protein [Mucilaginibacter gracilis]RKR81168.1 hypothetical protein BDD43_1312 [Mucilaginibacter gracilis]
MENVKPTSQPFRALQFVHGALCAGAILFLAFTMVLNGKKGHTEITHTDQYVLYIAIALALTMPFLSYMIFFNKVAKIDKAAPLSERITRYTSACIVRYATLQGVALFNLATWFATKNLILAAVGGAIILFLIVLRPVKRKVMADLQINYPDTLE